MDKGSRKAINSSQSQDEYPLWNSKLSPRTRFQWTRGLRVAGYTSSNASLIINRGAEISDTPVDAVGLSGGLKMEQAIRGHPILGNPDLGAIEMTPVVQPSGR